MKWETPRAPNARILEEGAEEAVEEGATKDSVQQRKRHDVDQL